MYKMIEFYNAQGYFSFFLQSIIGREGTIYLNQMMYYYTDTFRIVGMRFFSMGIFNKRLVVDTMENEMI